MIYFSHSRTFLSKYMYHILLLGIIIFFLFTRIYKITEIPPSLYWDEASIGYNAYSVIATGKDEWGKVLPLHFRAFGEFKLPVYIYTVSAFERFLGLNEMAVRLPSVFFSLGVLLLTFLFAFRISQSKFASFVAAFFLSISPWFFIFSRTGYEATGGLMFFMLGVYSFLFVKKGLIFFVVSALGFIISMYTYNSFRLVVPLTFVILLLSQYISLRDYSRKSGAAKFIILSMLVALFLSIIPIFRLVTNNSGTNRFQTIGLESEDKKQFITNFASNYLSHFNPDFLLINGDKNLRSQIGLGQIYWMDVPLILFGLFYLIKRRSFLFLLPIILALISFVPAAITRESPHALRSIPVIPFLSMISAFGLLAVVKTIKFKRGVMVIIILVSIISFANYFHIFLTTYSAEASRDWQYAYKRLFLDYKDRFGEYDYIVVSDHYAQPYIFGLYYLKYDPNRFRKEVKYNSPDKWGFSAVESFGNLLFRPIKLNNFPEGKLLVFASPEEKMDIPEKAEIKNLDGSVALYVYALQGKQGTLSKLW